MLGMLGVLAVLVVVLGAVVLKVAIQHDRERSGYA